MLQTMCAATMFICMSDMEKHRKGQAAFAHMLPLSASRQRCATSNMLFVHRGPKLLLRCP